MRAITDHDAPTRAECRQEAREAERGTQGDCGHTSRDVALFCSEPGCTYTACSGCREDAKKCHNCGRHNLCPDHANFVDCIACRLEAVAEECGNVAANIRLGVFDQYRANEELNRLALKSVGVEAA